MKFPAIGRAGRAVFLTLLASGVLYSQDDTPRFTSRSELVLVPAVVTDKSGNHISGLTKDDFVLLEDGKPQRISAFEEIRTTSGLVQRVASAPGEFSNVVQTGSGPKRLVIVALDLVNTPTLMQANARNELFKFLSKSLDPGDPTELVLIGRSGLHILHDFTGDPRILASALERLTDTRSSLAEKEPLSQIPAANDAISGVLAMLARLENENRQQLETFETRSAIVTTMQALQQIAGEVSGVPGRKALIWVSAGFPLSINPVQDVLSEPSRGLVGGSSVNDLYRQTWQMLNQAQLAVYPVDVRYLTNPGFQGADEHGVYFSPPRGPTDNPYSGTLNRGSWENYEILSTFRTFAEATGGRAYYNSNDLQKGMREAADDSASYYMLGYQLNRQGKKLGWHKLQVRTLRHDVEVRARNTFFLSDTAHASVEDDRASLRRAMQSPVDFTAIAIRGSWSTASDAGSANNPGSANKKTGFELVMPAGFADVDDADQNHMHVELLVKAVSEKGGDPFIWGRSENVHLDAGGLEQIRRQGMTFRGALNLPPGKYDVRFVVLDAMSGRTGSVAATLNVPQ